MEKYESPKMEVIELPDNDVIATSGTLVDGGDQGQTGGAMEWLTPVDMME